jgi:hypothetical protein
MGRLFLTVIGNLLRQGPGIQTEEGGNTPAIALTG